MATNDEVNISKFRSRTGGWALNDDKAWVSVKLGEMRSVLRQLDAARGLKSNRKYVPLSEEEQVKRRPPSVGTLLSGAA